MEIMDSEQAVAQNLFFNYQMPQIACNEILACVAIAIFFNRFCSTRIFTCRNGFAAGFVRPKTSMAR